jgi:hypothetical protein
MHKILPHSPAALTTAELCDRRPEQPLRNPISDDRGYTRLQRIDRSETGAKISLPKSLTASERSFMSLHQKIQEYVRASEALLLKFPELAQKQLQAVQEMMIGSPRPPVVR